MVLVATQVKRRRGTTAENDAFTGAEGEITVDTEKHELRVHDGLTQGGFKVGSGTGALIIGQILEVVGTADYTPVGCLLADGSEYTKEQFPNLWADFLTGTPKLQTCTYTEYANQIAEYGFCNKFAVDTTNETFKVPTRNKYRKLVKKIVNGTSWANLYDDGWVEQGGTITYANAEQIKTIVLPIEMTNSNYTLQLIRKDGSSPDTDSAYKMHQYNSKTTTGFSFWWSTNNRQSGVDWQVSGYTTIPDSTSNITREFVVVANGTLNQEQMDWSAWASSLAGRATTDMNNITSTGKENVIGWGIPDYSAGIDIMSSITSGYQAPKKGIVCFFTMTATTATNITVNNNLVLNKLQTSGNYSTSMFVPLEKNDVIKSTAVSGGSVIFFPFKGV